MSLSSEELVQTILHSYSWRLFIIVPESTVRAAKRVRESKWSVGRAEAVRVRGVA
jgi:hypothetical protein